LGQVTPAALNYLEVPGVQTGNIIQTVVDVNVTGDLGKYGIQLPTAASGLKVNIGAEWRDVTEETTPDEEFRTGDLAGSGGPTPPTSGGIISREVFAEARLPLVEDKFLAKSLSVETGYRYSDYNLGFKTNTYKFGVEYQPISDIRLRGSFQRAVRAPNVTELFLPQTVLLDGNTDPCASTAPKLPAATQAGCRIRYGVGQPGQPIPGPDRRKPAAAAGDGAYLVVWNRLDSVVRPELAGTARLFRYQNRKRHLQNRGIGDPDAVRERRHSLQRYPSRCQ
jgi:hypothetical protein